MLRTESQQNTRYCNLSLNRHEADPVSKCMVTQVAIDSEVRDNLLSECPGLKGLVSWLDSIDRRPGLAELDNHLSNLEVNRCTQRMHRLRR